MRDYAPSAAAMDLLPIFPSVPSATKAAKPLVLHSGGKRRAASLDPIVARLRDGLQALIDEHMPAVTKYSDDQPRDDRGRFADGGSSTGENSTYEHFSDVARDVRSAQSRGEQVYVRYSRGPAADRQAGYSTDYARGEAELGIAAENLTPQTEHREYDDFGPTGDITWTADPPPSDQYVAMQLESYSYMRGQGIEGTRGYLFTAERTGTNSDNGPLVDASTIHMLGWVSDAAIEEAHALRAGKVAKGGPLTLTDKAKALLLVAYQQAMRAGWDDSGAEDAGWSEDDAATYAEQQSSWIGHLVAGLGAALLAGSVSQAMADARMGLTANGLISGYERGFGQGVTSQGEVQRSTWQAEMDGETCDLCDARDGQSWDGDPPFWPGDGGFGDEATVCRGSTNCRCEILYEIVPADEAAPLDAGESDVQTAALSDLTAMTVADLLALRARVAKYSEDQPRDDHGRFGTTGYVPAEAAKAARDLAVTKYLRAPQPTADQRAWMRALYARVGAARAHSMLRGNARDRAASKRVLLSEFGDGHHAPCVYCGAKLDFDTVTRDRIWPGAEGGRYVNANLVPACGPCNKMRGDLPFANVMQAVNAAFAGVTKAAEHLVGQRVTAAEFVSPDSDRRPRILTGVLASRYVPGLDYDRLTVDGVAVQPETVRPAE